MNGLFSDPVLLQLISTLSCIFAGATKPTLFLLLLTAFSVCALNDCKSVRFMYQHFHSSLVTTKLSSLYAMFSVARIDLDSWSSHLCKLLTSLIPKECIAYPIFLVIDDSLIEKVGRHFEACSKLFDHASHNGTNYLHGHCVVTLVVLIPVLDKDNNVTYVRVPVKHKLWIPKKAKGKGSESDKESLVPDIPYRSKYQILRDILVEAVNAFGASRKYVLLADSWYPKGEILDFVNENENVEAVFNVPINTVIYKAAVPKPTGKRGRPREIGDRLSPKTDFPRTNIAGTNYLAGLMDVTSNLFGKKKLVKALVTESKEAKSTRLFICTNPDACAIPTSCIMDKLAKAMIEAIPESLCFASYSLRWQIETTYLELKAHWSFSDYMLRSVKGIERLINLQSMVYAVLCVAPWIDPVFKPLAELSIQERRYIVGKAINQDLFLRSISAELEMEGNSKEVVTAFNDIAQKMRCFGKTGTAE